MLHQCCAFSCDLNYQGAVLKRIISLQANRVSNLRTTQKPGRSITRNKVCRPKTTIDGSHSVPAPIPQTLIYKILTFQRLIDSDLAMAVCMLVRRKTGYLTSHLAEAINRKPFTRTALREHVLPLYCLAPLLVTNLSKPKIS